MKVSDAKLAEVWDRGFAVVEGFLDAQTLAAAREAMFQIHPKPEDYFANPEAWPQYATSQFAGLNLFPFSFWALNQVAVYPDLTNAAERLLQTRDLEIYKVELWAKYAGAINYDQAHHRDFGNHGLVVPRKDGRHTQMTTFVLLSDVTELDGPTKLVPLEHGRDVPLIPNLLPFGELFDKEVAATAAAGSLMIYKTDVLHRGSDFKAPGRSRFAMLIDFQERGWRWNNKMSWGDRADQRGMKTALSRMTPRQRDLFGWPPVGSEYWNAQTLADVALRYPEMDLTPYAEGLAG